MDSKNMPSLNDNVKKTKGRQKIEMKKMSNERNLQVTFSKRRTGIFKKASELTTLCGVDIAVIVFSPGNRVFSFGSPNVDSVIQRYMTQAPPSSLTQDLNEAYCTMDERELHAHLNYLDNQFAIEKKRMEDLNRLLKVAKDHFWWATPIESMNKAQLEKYKKALEELKTCVSEKREKLIFESVLTYNSSTQFFAGGSSSSNVKNTMIMRPPPLMQNHMGVIDGSILRHRQFNNIHGHEHGDGPTLRFF